jgi:hypothetical protein
MRRVALFLLLVCISGCCGERWPIWRHHRRIRAAPTSDMNVSVDLNEVALQIPGHSRSLAR